MTDAEAKLRYLVEQLHVAAACSSALPTSHFARLFARATFVLVDSFLCFAPYLNNRLLKEGALSAETHADVKARIGAIRRDYEGTYDRIRDNTAAHRQELGWDDLLAVWHDIDSVAVEVFRDLCTDVYDRLQSEAELERWHVEPLPEGFEDEVRSLEKRHEWIVFAGDNLGLSRPGTATTLPNHPDVEKATRVVAIVDSIDFLAHLSVLTATHQQAHMLLWSLLVSECVSLVENVFEDQAPKPKYGVEADPSLLSRWDKGGYRGASFLRDFERDRELEANLRAVRNKAGAHVDARLPFSEVMDLFVGIPAGRLRDYLDDLTAALWKGFHSDLRTVHFSLHGKEVKGILPGKTSDSPDFEQS